jgi:hypothetical protein
MTLSLPHPLPPLSVGGGGGGVPGGGAGAVLRIYQQVGRTQQATRLIPPAEIAWQNAEQNPLGRVQRYVGPADFAVRPVPIPGGGDNDK